MSNYIQFEDDKALSFDKKEPNPGAKANPVEYGS